ncbi:hypothetical protein CSB45_04125 [candidate division KSB3 bacterium]|uniref:Rqc2 homolog RqcH n=1 Tax=candidate division KSB3 bacterium TaxID=2044937 RepID=A0A2G6E8T0_9BACT|nr:MAG: hypothetical protein CSB45_04125 [candidate division KSB3 bacterium]PIE30566.1 MAG: hypothetical protein CSA57_02710 [candidate division KSB3 bacterium]
MDTFVLNAVCKELQAQICPSWINNIFQTDEFSLLFVLWCQQREICLAVSVDARFQYVYLTRKKPDAQVSTFGKFLLHHIKGAKIRSITKAPLERILSIDLVKKDIDGSDLTFQLILEIMGRHSNLILLQQATHKILESLRHVTAAQSSYRRIAPGAVYVAPPQQKKLDLSTLAESDFLKIVRQFHEEAAQNPGLQLWNVLLQRIQGLSPLLAKDIAGQGSKNCWERLEAIRDMLCSEAYRPCIVLQHVNSLQEKALAVSAFPLEQFSQKKNIKILTFESMSAAAEAYYSSQAEQQRSDSLRSSLLSPLKQRLAKLRKKQEHLQEQQKHIAHAQDYKQQGELIAANIYRLKKGMSRARIIDYYHPEHAEIEIELNPRLNPSQNAQHCFKRYNKLKQGQVIAEQRLADAEQEIAYLEELQFFVEDANSLTELRRLKKEAQDKHALNKPQKNMLPPKPKEPAKPFRRFMSSDGFEVYVGRSSRENDLLTQKYARPDDIWLHAHRAPGSHVLILNRRRKMAIPGQTLQEAASLALYYSKLRCSGKADVMYTARKHLKKPKGAPPGLVTVSQFQTIHAVPQSEISIKH